MLTQQHVRQSIAERLLVAVALVLSVSLAPHHSSSQPLAHGHSKFLGNVFGSFGTPRNFDSYWNQITPENNGKWDAVEGARDVYNLGRLDEIYNYAVGRGFPFKLHTLIWGQQYPSWIMTLDTAQQREEVEEWIKLIGERYPQMSFVDVVNEPLPNHAPAPYRNALGGSGATGYDWVIRAFELARQYCAPGVKLHLNEYNILNSDANTTEYLRIINLLQARGLIDGIGVQGHRFEVENVSVITIGNNLDRLAATGLPIYISEFDIGNIGNAGAPDDAQQLQIYQTVFPVLWEHPGVKGITFWGYIQGQIWQTTTYLLRSDGTERPALQWLRQYLSTGGFRSTKSGNWNDVASWEWYNGSAWVPASNAPTLADGPITILDGDTITVTAADSADQVTVASGGTLMINAGVAFQIKDGDGTDLAVYGTVVNSGSLTSEASASINFEADSKYLHARDGGSIPTAAWRTGSTCQIDSVKGTAPANGNQSFYHVVWNCPGQTGNLNMGWNGITIGGNITVQSTGSGRWQMCAPAAGTAASVTIKGNVIQSGGQFTTNGTSNAGTTITINHSGNINVTGGNFSISRGSQGATGTTVWNLTNGNVSLTDATTQNSNSAGAKFVFTKDEGTQTLTFSGVTFGGGGFPVEVDSGTTLDLGTSVLGGSGGFYLKAGAALQSSSVYGLDSSLATTGTKTLSKAASYVFRGSAAQMTGNLLPDTVGGLTINNSAGLTLSKSVTVNGTVEVTSGVLSLAGNVLRYGANGVLRYAGSLAKTTTDAEFPPSDGPKDLLIATTSGVTLHASRTISGDVELSRKLTLGANTLTAASTSKANLANYLIVSGAGALKLTAVGSSQTLFPVGTSAGYAPVWITNSGTSDTIGVTVSNDSSAAAFGGRVMVKWDISESTVGGGNYTLQFGWNNVLEDAAFRANRATDARIFLLTDTTEAGVGEYTMQFSSRPYSVARGGITTLGSFAVGRFKLTTEVAQVGDGVPGEFSLSQNYPNPFNPSTTISFQLSTNSFVTLKVFDVLGREVATLVDENRKAGVHKATWDGRNYEGDVLPSGMYVYRLTTEAFVQAKKMLLLK